MLFNKARANKLMQEQSIDVLIATSSDNVHYLTNHQNVTHEFIQSSNIFALYAPGTTPDACAIIPAIEAETFVTSESWIQDVYLVGLFTRARMDGAQLDSFAAACEAMIDKASQANTAIEGLVTALSRRGLTGARIGLDETGLSVLDWNRVVAALPDATIVPAGSLLLTSRLVKTPEEIERLRRASEITELAVKVALEELRPGVSDLEMQRRYEIALIENGANPSFTLFASGSRSSQPQLITVPRIIEAGDLVRWDLGCRYNRYHSDTARAVILGEPSDRQARIWDALSTGVENALALIRPGVMPFELFEAAISPLRGLNLPNYERFHCGHGIGISVYDPPMVAAADAGNSVFRIAPIEGGLEAGMVLNVEVGYYVHGVEGFLCEDTILVTDNGLERFTNAPKSLDLAVYMS
jgi:Xaa-Pro dipeptidase